MRRGSPDPWIRGCLTLGTARKENYQGSLQLSFTQYNQENTRPNNVPPLVLTIRFGAGRARSDVFDGPGGDGFSEVKKNFGFCFRRSVIKIKKITPAAPHHRKVSAPRPPLRSRYPPCPTTTLIPRIFRVAVSFYGN